MRQWSTHELMYLEEHAGEGAKAIAKALGRSEDSVKWQAQRCGLSLRKRSHRINGWCIECTKELHMSDLAEQANAMREEAIREKRNNQERQRYYSAKSRAKKKQK